MAESNARKTRSHTRRHRKTSSTSPSSETRGRRHRKTNSTSPNSELRPLFKAEARRKFNSESNMMRDPHLFLSLRTEYGSLQRKYSAVDAQNKEYEKHVKHTVYCDVYREITPYFKQIQQLQHENDALNQQLSHFEYSPRIKPRVYSPTTPTSISIPDFSEDHSEEIETLQKTNRKYVELIKRLKSKNSATREENQRLWVELDRVNKKNEVMSAENAQKIQENNRLHSKNIEIKQENGVIQQVHGNHVAHHLEQTSSLQEEIQRLRDELCGHKQKEIFASVINDLKKSEHNEVTYEIKYGEEAEKNDVISEFSDDDFDEMQALFEKCERERIAWHRPSISIDAKPTHCRCSLWSNFYF